MTLSTATVLYAQGGFLKRLGRADVLASSARSALVVGVDKPDPDLSVPNVGVIPGVTRSTDSTSGTLSITGAATYSNVTFNRYVDVSTSALVTFNNCLFRGPASGTQIRGLVNCTNASVANAVFNDCTFQPQTPSAYVDGIRGHHFTLNRCLIKNTCDGIGIFNNAAPNGALGVTVRQCWIGLLAYFAPDPSGQHDGDAANPPYYSHTHNDLIQMQVGGTGLLAEGNSFYGYLDLTIGQAALPVGDATTPGNLHYPYTQNQVGIQINITGTNTFGSHVVQKNWFAGTAACLNMNYAVDFGQFNNNVITNDQRPDSNWVIQSTSGATVHRTGNHYEDGSAIRVTPSGLAG